MAEGAVVYIGPEFPDRRRVGHVEDEQARRERVEVREAAVSAQHDVYVVRALQRSHRPGHREPSCLARARRVGDVDDAQVGLRVRGVDCEDEWRIRREENVVHVREAVRGARPAEDHVLAQKRRRGGVGDVVDKQALRDGRDVQSPVARFHIEHRRRGALPGRRHAASVDQAEPLPGRRVQEFYPAGGVRREEHPGIAPHVGIRAETRGFVVMPDERHVLRCRRLIALGHAAQRRRRIKRAAPARPRQDCVHRAEFVDLKLRAEGEAAREPGACVQAQFAVRQRRCAGEPESRGNARLEAPRILQGVRARRDTQREPESGGLLGRARPQRGDSPRHRPERSEWGRSCLWRRGRRWRGRRGRGRRRRCSLRRGSARYLGRRGVRVAAGAGCGQRRSGQRQQQRRRRNEAGARGTHPLTQRPSARSGRRPRCRRSRSSPPGSSPGTAGGSARRRRTPAPR